MKIKLFIFSLMFSFGLILSGCQSEDLTKLDEWDVVIISASNGWGLGEQMKPMIEEELGIDVNIHDFAIGSLSAVNVLTGFEGTTPNANLEKLKEIIPDAEMIVLFVDPEDIATYESNLWDQCFMGMTIENNDGCGPEKLGNYDEVLSKIYDHIFTLKGNSPVIIRALGFYNPLISDWKKVDSVDTCNQCWLTFNEEIRKVSENYNIPFADVWTTFNGENHLDDPRQKGYILEDGQHCTDLGAKAQAETILALGYEPIKR